jgi:hypothetical protein
MRKIMFLTMAVVLVFAFGITPSYAQHMGPGMMGPGYGYQQQGGWNYCPYCGSYMGPGYGMGPGMMGRGYSGYGMGPGMMGRGYSGYGMGPGMMGRGYGGYGMGPGMMGRGYGGYGMGPGMMGPQYGPQYGPGYQGPQYQPQQKPMDEQDAKSLLENYLQSTRNPNLRLGKIEDKGNAFEAEIQTKDGSLVDKILVDKRTGWMHSVY